MTSTVPAASTARLFHRFGIRPLEAVVVILGFMTSAVVMTGCTATSGVVTRFPGGSAQPIAVPAEPPVAPAPPSSTAGETDARTAARTRIANQSGLMPGPSISTIRAQDAGVPQADDALARGDFTAATRLYESAAAASTGSRAAEYLLRAAEAALAAGDPIRADALLDRVNTAQPGLLTARQQARYRLFRAESTLQRGDSARALQMLSTVDFGSDPALGARLQANRAHAFEGSGDLAGVVQALVLRERYLTDSAAITENRDRLWALLQGPASRGPIRSSPRDGGTSAIAQSIAQGWIDLAALARRSAALGDFETWRQRYPRHPGEERLAGLMIPGDPRSSESVPSAAGAAAPITITGAGVTGPTGSFVGVAPRSGDAALLLPRAGPLMTLADAVRDGYRMAATQAGSREPRLYDADAYALAVNDGASFIVGPLLKEPLARLAQGTALPLPVLGLNYLDPGRAAPPGLYQFGLAPEDEARAAAEDAWARGLRRALTMTPATDRGNRVQAAFESRLRELGGVVAEAGRYSGPPQSWSDPIRRLLRYVAIDDKKKAAAARARVGPGIDPQRRNDFDFVFIDARASQARVLWPLFRYYHADRTPIYATSAVHEGPGDADLSGIRFCDVPWLLDSSDKLAALHDAARANRSLEAARFYAFGADAQLLAGRIGSGGLKPGDELPGATGLLRVEADGVIRRLLPCAQMTSSGPAARLPDLAVLP